MCSVKLVICLSVFCVLSMSTFADISNGEFDTDLSGWDYNSGVMFSNDPYYPESARLFPLAEEGQEPLYSSILSQAFTTDGMNLLTFSFNPVIFGDEEIVETDHFFASLDQTNFFHWSSDLNEEPELAEGVTMGEADDEGWIMISLMLPGDTDSATLRFELIHDYDLMDAETTIYIDHVTLSNITAVVPVPGAVLLAGMGSFLVISFRRKNK
jgi:hypothetical protein